MRGRKYKNKNHQSQEGFKNNVAANNRGFVANPEDFPSLVADSGNKIVVTIADIENNFGVPLKTVGDFESFCNDIENGVHPKWFSIPKETRDVCVELICARHKELMDEIEAAQNKNDKDAIPPEQVANVAEHNTNGADLEVDNVEIKDDGVTHVDVSSGPSFASLVNSDSSSTKVYFGTLVNDKAFDNADCVLPKILADSIKGRYENSVVGFFVGKEPYFQAILNYAKNTWSKFGFEKITRNDAGVYLIKFASKHGMEQVLERGPWMIHKSPIILNKWSSSVPMTKGVVTKVPVWVKLYNVPVLAYSGEGLSLIATMIGKPIMLDAYTSSMCVDSWGKIRFARALIEVSADNMLKKEVSMAIPNDDETDYTIEKIRVEYEWKPPHCVDCKCFGHDSTLCPKRVRHEAPNRPKVNAPKSSDDEGFVEVKSRKKKNSEEAQKFGGIKLNKPKSSIKWQVKKNGADLSKGSDTGKNLQSIPSTSCSNSFGVLSMESGQAQDCINEDSDEEELVSLDDNVKGAPKDYCDIRLSQNVRK